MLLLPTLRLLGLLAFTVHTQATSSPKRGLIYIASNDHASDDALWGSSSSDLTWYYNYGASPSSAIDNGKLQFVPMLFGAPASVSDTTFLNAVTALQKSGTNISHVLSFNEPDGQASTGGSSVPAALAAQIWATNVEPLKAKGVKLGAPAVTGSSTGLAWLRNFFAACNGGCSADFIPVHWYGNFEGLASHIGEVRSAFQNTSIWVTEFANAGASLVDAQTLYNQSTQYLDRLDYVERYSYFGSFRSDVSNVGPNVAMLTPDGKLTDIGAWYLGGSATGNVPTSRAPTFADVSRTCWAAVVLGMLWRLL